MPSAWYLDPDTSRFRSTRKASGRTILIYRELCGVCTRKGHIKAACTIATNLGPTRYNRTLSSTHNNSIDGDAMTSICERQPGLNDKVYEIESEALLAATGVTLVSGMMNVVALPVIWQAEDASEVEAPIVGVALEEIAGTSQLGTHGHRRDCHWTHVNRHPSRQTTDASFLSQRIDAVTMALETCA